MLDVHVSLLFRIVSCVKVCVCNLYYFFVRIKILMFFLILRFDTNENITVFTGNISQLDCFNTLFSQENYENSIQFLKECGSMQKKGKRNVAMYCFGSTNFACNSPRIQFGSSKIVMMPRPYALFRPNKKQFKRFIEDKINFLPFIHHIEVFCFQYLCFMKNKEQWAEKAFVDMNDSKILIPKCCRVHDTAFTFMSLNGDMQSNKNGIGRHVDANDSFNLIVHVGDCKDGGATLYFNGKDGNNVCKKINFVNGNIQIGQYSHVYHGTEAWVGKRCSIAFSVKHTILDYFRSYGRSLYEKYIVADNYKCPNICIRM